VIVDDQDVEDRGAIVDVRDTSSSGRGDPAGCRFVY
jgi:hypothetical protein